MMKLKYSFVPLLLLLLLLWLPVQAQQPTPTPTLIPGVPVLEPQTSLASITPSLLPTQTATPLNIDAPLLEPVFSHTYAEGIGAIIWHPDGQTLVINYGGVAGRETSPYIYNTIENNDVWRLSDQTLQLSFNSEMSSRSFSNFYTPDGTVLVYATDMGEVQGYDATNGRQIYAINLDDEHSAPAPAPLAYARDRAILRSDSNRRAFPVDLRTGAKLFATESEHQFAGFSEIIWSYDAEIFYSISYDNLTLTAYDGQTGIELYSLSEIIEIKISPDSRLLAARGSEGTFIRETATGQLVREVNGFGRWSPKSDSWLTAQNNTVEILYLDGSFRLIPEPATSGYFSPNGQYVITSLTEDRTLKFIKVWEVDSASNVFTLPTGMGVVSWSPDSRYMVAGTWLDRRFTDLFIYETGNWTPIYQLAFEPAVNPYIRTLEWSPNGHMIALSIVSLNDEGSFVDDTKPSTAYVFSLSGLMDVSAAPTATPSPTSTPTIPPTATSTFTPTPTPRLHNVLFTDDFSSNTLDWETGQLDNTFSNIVDDRYVIEYTAQTSGFGWYIAPGYTDSALAPQITGDFEYSINVSNITSSTGSYRLTLLIGVQPNYSDYQIINLSLPQGRVTVGDAEEFIRQEGQVSAIPPDFLANGGGKVSVVVKGTTLTLKINDQNIYSTSIDSLPTGSIGFGLGSVSGEISTTRAEFDDLEVLVP